MAKLSIAAGAVSQSVNIFIQDSSKTTGAGLTGLVYNSTGLIAYSTFTGANTAATTITLATLAAVNSAYSSGGFIEIDSVHMPGLYRLDLPNTALASGKGQSVTVMLSGAVNMAPVVLEIELTAVNNQSAGFGLVNASANVVQWNGAAVVVPNTVGLPVVDIESWDGTAVPAAAAAGIPDINVKNINNTAAMTPGTSGGVLIAGANAATTIAGLTLTGAAASGSTAAASGLTVTGGAASTVAGGTAAAGFAVTGGAGAASVNGAAAGAIFTAGGTTTVSGSDGVKFTGTGNGSGLTGTHAGTGVDLNCATSAPLQVNTTQINGVSTSSVTAIYANQGTSQPLNFTGIGASALVQGDVKDIAGAVVSTTSAQVGVNVVTNGDKTGYSLASGQLLLQKNTAYNNFQFVMTDSVNHQPKTTLTVSGTTGLDGAAFVALTNAVVEVANGWYKVNLAAADVNGTDVALRFTASGADDLNIKIVTQAG